MEKLTGGLCRERAWSEIRDSTALLVEWLTNHGLHSALLSPVVNMPQDDRSGIAKIYDFLLIVTCLF